MKDTFRVFPGNGKKPAVEISFGLEFENTGISPIKVCCRDAELFVFFGNEEIHQSTFQPKNREFEIGGNGGEDRVTYEAINTVNTRTLYDTLAGYWGDACARIEVISVDIFDERTSYAAEIEFEFAPRIQQEDGNMRMSGSGARLKKIERILLKKDEK